MPSTHVQGVRQSSTNQLLLPKDDKEVTSQNDTRLQKVEQEDVRGLHQEEVLILSLQATINSLEKKVSALRRSEQAAMKVLF